VTGTNKKYITFLYCYYYAVAMVTVVVVTAALRCDDEWKSSCSGRHVTPVRPMTSYMTSPGVSGGRHERMSVDSCVGHHTSIGDYLTPVLYSRVVTYQREQWHDVIL